MLGTWLAFSVHTKETCDVHELRKEQLKSSRCETKSFPLFQGPIEDSRHEDVVVEMLSAQATPEPALHRMPWSR